MLGLRRLGAEGFALWSSVNWRLWLAVVFLAILAMVVVLLQTGVIPAGDIPRAA